jgi:probable phosphoglycerate mutase
MAEGRSVRLYLVRHGTVAANVDRRYIGRRDDLLSEEGTAQAGALGTLFAELDVTAVLSSPLRRTMATAEQIAVARGLVVKEEPRLIEMAFGEWEGLSRAELLVSDGDGLARWERDPDTAPPGGESLAAAGRRVVDLADELLRSNATAPVVLVSHVGPIKALLCAALNLGLDNAARVYLDPATVSVVDWADRPVVRLMNSHAHLGWTAARWLEQA